MVATATITSVDMRQTRDTPSPCFLLRLDESTPSPPSFHGWFSPITLLLVPLVLSARLLHVAYMGLTTC